MPQRFNNICVLAGWYKVDPLQIIVTARPSKA